MEHLVLTISREFGSGGRTIGKETAQRLGIPCYDEELISKIAEESGLDEGFVAEKAEYASHGNNLVNTLFAGRTAGGFSMQDYLWTVQRKVILDLARSSCVIVGRCADYILKDTCDCLNVMIHAPADKRAQRIVNVYGESEESPEKRVKDKDKRRKAYYYFYTGQEWGNPDNYDICLDSDRLGIEGCVALLEAAYRRKAGE